MLDLNLVRQELQRYKKDCERKHINIDVDHILKLDDQRKIIQNKIDSLKFKQKELASQKDYQGAKNLKTEIQQLEEQYKKIQEELNNEKLKMPGFIHPDVPVGEDESENVVIKTFGKIPNFDFKYKNHIELMQKYDMIDIERGVKIAGSRSYFLKNDGALLEQALLQYSYKKIIQKGFSPLLVPNIVNTKTLEGTGYFPGGEDDAYNMEKDNKRLIGTSEIPITAYHSNEILNTEDLPKTYVGLSPCYRREAGTYGKDTSGLYRVHQFNKVEQVILIPADKKLSDERHQKILKNSMEILNDLELPYRLLQLCTGDLALGKYNSHDLECRMPSRNSYGETHSATSFLDFQSRRLNIRYRDNNGEIKYCYTLNNTAIATPRILISIIENNQTKDGKIKIPKILQDYMGKQIIG